MATYEDIDDPIGMDADGYEAAYANLEADNARLRTALREIRDAKTYGECAEAVAKAREVLGDD